MSGERSIWSGGPWSIVEVDETGSTNDDLIAAAGAGDLANRTVLRTDHQTAGRGRLDRRWDAPPTTNLLASMYLAEVGDRAAEAVQRVGLAIVEAVESLTRQAAQPVEVGLKWPNDVLCDGTKLAGVLAQRSSTVAGVVVGFGVNVGWAPTGGVRIVDLLDAETAADATPGAVLRRVLDAFDGLPEAPTELAGLYRRRLLTLGRQVRVLLPGDTTFEGQAVGLDAVGRIVVRAPGGDERSFDVGDVVHLRTR